MFPILFLKEDYRIFSSKILEFIAAIIIRLGYFKSSYI